MKNSFYKRHNKYFRHKEFCQSDGSQGPGSIPDRAATPLVFCQIRSSEASPAEPRLHCLMNSFRFLILLLCFVVGPGGLRWPPEAPGRPTEGPRGPPRPPGPGHEVMRKCADQKNYEGVMGRRGPGRDRPQRPPRAARRALRDFETDLRRNLAPAAPNFVSWVGLMG